MSCYLVLPNRNESMPPYRYAHLSRFPVQICAGTPPNFSSFGNVHRFFLSLSLSLSLDSRYACRFSFLFPLHSIASAPKGIQDGDWVLLSFPSADIWWISWNIFTKFGLNLSRIYFIKGAFVMRIVFISFSLHSIASTAKGIQDGDWVLLSLPSADIWFISLSIWLNSAYIFIGFISSNVRLLWM